MNNIAEFFNEEATQWDGRYTNDPRFSRRLARIEQFLELVLPPSKGKSALDMGCGSGVFSRILSAKGWKVTGVDVSEEMVDAARQASSESIDFKVSSVEKFAADAATSYDVIVSFSMLEYIQEDDRALDSLAGLLVKDGVLVLSVPNRVGLLRKIEGMIFGIRQLSGHRIFRNRGEYLLYQKHQYTPLELDLMLRQSGFRKLRGTFLNSGIVSPIWLASLLERKWWASMYCAAYRRT